MHNPYGVQLRYFYSGVFGASQPLVTIHFNYIQNILLNIFCVPRKTEHYLLLWKNRVKQVWNDMKVYKCWLID